MTRAGSGGPNQTRPGPVSRPRTPEGPRANIDPTRDLTSPRGPALRDGQPPRQLRYDQIRSNNGRPAPGFRAPPPTGPRASGPPPISGPPQSINTSRPQHSGRPVGPINPPVSRPSPPQDRLDQASSSTAGALGMNPERAAMIGISGRDGQIENASSQRSSSVNDPRTIKSHSAVTDSAVPVSNREVNQSSEVPRGPSEWRGRPKRDLQDEDPRRLSRGPDVWDNKGSSETERPSRSDEKVRSTSTRQHESPKDVPSTRTRPTREREEQDHNDSSRSSREQERARSDTLEGRKTRVVAAKPDVTEREVNTRTRVSSLNSRSEQTRNITDSQTRIASSTGTRETREAPKETSARDAKENLPVEKKSVHKERQENGSRETKEVASKDQKPANPRDEEPVKRREERDPPSRAKKDEPRELRHDRRDGHHGRTTSSRRSPSRTLSDRGDKKDRERESERRSASRRETRDNEHREKERPARESEHRRETRDRERSNRDRDPDNRRGARKHERDKSADGLDRGLRSGDVGEGSSAGDSALPSKRRRVDR
jgi:hypothetical protein